MPKILCVDDSPTSLEWLTVYLEMFGGHRVAEAKSARQAMDLMMSHRFQVLVFDYMVAELNGLELLRWARNHDVDTPCILISAILEEDLEEIARKADAEGLGPIMALPKTREPPSVILAEINKILQRNVHDGEA